MLSFLVYVVGMLLLFASIYGLTIALIWRNQSKRQKNVNVLAVVIGVVAGLSIYTAKCLRPKELLRFLTLLNRKVIVLACVLACLAFLLFLLHQLLMYKKDIADKEKLVSNRLVNRKHIFSVTLYLFSLSLIPLIAHILPQLLLKTGEFVAFNEESISTGTLFRFVGYALGLLLAFLTGLSVFQAYRRLPDKFAYRLAALHYCVIVLDLLVRGVSSAARLGLLSSRNNFIFAIMIFEDKSLPYFAVAYGLMALLTSIVVYASHRKLIGEFKTAAMKRKAAWWQRNCRRWAKSLLVFSLLSVICLTIVNDYITRPVKLTPPEDYQMENEQIIIDLKKVEDGHLHRFAYMFDQHNIRFIVVRKPNSNAYGVGLDACSICGIAGYFERGDTVVCKRCDVVMNKATIGFLGGCNPVPFPYEVKDGRIIINKADLEKEANRFPVGA